MDRQETIADIIAEKRRRAEEIERDCAEKMKRGEMVSDCFARELVADIRREADRLDAAHKREKSAIEADALAVGGIVEAARRRESEESKHREEVKSLQATIRKLNDALTEQNGERGNSAALREALQKAAESAAEIMERVRHKDGLAFNTANYIAGVARTALAAPPRNCDRFGGDIDKLREACARERGLNPEEDFPDVFPDWLLALAKKGGAK